jgi:hypothetical protein
MDKIFCKTYDPFQPTKIFLGEGIKKIYLGQKVNERDRKKLARLLRRST